VILERPGLLAMTVHSILARTPPSILEQIIMVDDNGESPEEREGVDEDEIVKMRDLHPTKILYIKNERKKGCVGSRMEGIRAATAEVIMIVDSHIEMYSSTWAQHLLLPIIENPFTMSMQQIKVIDDRPGHKRYPANDTVQVWGGINDEFFFTNFYSRFLDAQSKADDPLRRETPSQRLPYETPFAPGSLFAMRRNEFWRLGGYDEGLGIWGGENTELVMKVWRCGFHNEEKKGSALTGRVVVVPCSRVGHVYRVNIKETGRWPPSIPDYVREQYGLDGEGSWNYRGSVNVDDFGKIIVRNNMRILRVWMGRDSIATKHYYYKGFKQNSTDPMGLAPEWRKYEIEMDTDKNQCKDFEWFDRHVYHKLLGIHHPWHETEWLPTSCGAHSAKSCGECPQGNGETWCNGDCRWCEYGGVGDSFLYFEETLDKLGLSEKSKCVAKELTCRGSMPKFQMTDVGEENL
jgi:glycosyltransferase involved in cell wall biosynthesis